MELGGGGWSWVKVGAQFSNTHNKSNLLVNISKDYHLVN